MTPEQRRKLNAQCGDLAVQVEWVIRYPNGEEVPTMLHRDDWRHMFAGIQLGQRITRNPENPQTFMTLSASSLRMTTEEASECIDRIAAFGNAKGVQWSDPEVINELP